MRRTHKVRMQTGNEKVGGERTSCSKSVRSCELPHTSKKLGKAANKESHTDNYIGSSDTTSLNVVQGEDQSCRRERKQTPSLFGKNYVLNTARFGTYRGPGFPILLAGLAATGGEPLLPRSAFSMWDMTTGG